MRHLVAVAPSDVAQSTESDMPCEARWYDAAGLFYVGCSVALSFASVFLAEPYLQSDSFWPEFQPKNISTVLAAVYNLQLTLTNVASGIELTDAALALSPLDMVGINAAYPRRIMYEELTDVGEAIAGLRRVSAGNVAYVSPQYCWADVDRRWEMAHTARRQQRCDEFWTANGAVHLETVLRNIDMHAWLALAATSFELYIANGMAALPGGADWVDATRRHVLVSVPDEIAFWHAHNLTHFKLQWSNRNQIGIQETLSIGTSVFGSLGTLAIKSIPASVRNALVTSNYMNMALQYDFNALESTNLSLIRSAPAFFEANNVSLIEAFAVGLPLSLLYDVVHRSIGSLGTIDLLWVPVPATLRKSVQRFRAHILQSVQADMALATIFASIDTTVLHPTPPRWNDPDFIFYGGNPMCGYGSALPYPQESWGFSDACASQNPFSTTLTSFSGLFAYTMLGGSVQQPCALLRDAPRCETMLDAIAASYARLAPSNDTLLLPNATDELAHLLFLQYVATTNANTTVFLAQQPLLADGAWAFFGWAALYDWAMNMRTVLQVEGDVDRFDVMSFYYPPVPSQLGASLVVSWAAYLRICMLVSSSLLGGVALLIAVVHVVSGRPAGSHWFVFNRIASTVWLNRGLLLLRTLVALICLSTAPIVPTTTSYDWVHFSTARRSVVASCLLAGETTWLTYVLHELLHPLVGNLTPHYAPPSSVLAFLLIAGLDVVGSIPTSASISRSCYSVEMDYMIYCTSGHASTRSLAWSAAILGLNIISVGVCLLLAHAYQKPGPVLAVIPNLLLPPAAVAFHRYPQSAPTGVRLNDATLALCGILHFSRPRLLFDTKLWLPVRADDVRRHVGAVDLPHCIALSTKAAASPRRGTITWTRRVHRTLHKITLVGGFSYLLCSLYGNYFYLGVTQEYLANDYGWVDYNATGARSFVANLFNVQLFLATNMTTSLILDAPDMGDWQQSYNTSETNVLWPDAMARRQLYQPNPPLDEIILGLRAMDPCMLPWMFTQYCWLDWSQTWPMASTAARQARCVAHRSNGARYLESALRNILDWAVWDRCWGDAFEVGIARDVASTMHGQMWLNATMQAHSISIADETKFWAAHGLTTFVLQWQNYKSVGLLDSIQIRTALGASYPVRLSARAGSTHLSQETSRKMYWAFASDLWAATCNSSGVGGLSLLASSPRFAYSNVSSEHLLISNGSFLSAPLSAGLTSLRAAVGPFNAVDMTFVPVPNALLSVYTGLANALSALLYHNASAQAAFFELRVAASMGALPAAYGHRWTIGSNLLCGDDVPPNAVAFGWNTYFGMASMCHSYYNEYMFPTRLQLLLAVLSSPPTNYEAVCALDIYASSTCATDYRAIAAFAMTYNLSIHAASVAAATAATVAPSVVLYLLNASLVELTSIPLLQASDNGWSFFGWCYLYEWIVGLRDVVAFEGDHGVITAISSRSHPLVFAPDASEIPHSLSYLFQCCVQYITTVLLCVAACVALSTIAQRGHVERLNLFELNRIVGHVWIGRLFLVVRAITAIWLLNTSTLTLRRIGCGTWFSVPSLPWYKLVVASAESTWLVYVLNDLLSCVTGPYTSYYAMKSSFLAWVVVAVWTAASPQAYTALLDRHCEFVDMDTALHCASGYVEIGNASRVGLTALICIGSVVGCYSIERLYRPRLVALAIPTQLLNAQSFYMLDMTDWVVHGEFFLDKTSAFMAGVIAIEWRRRLYVLDIKSWRGFSIGAMELDRRLTSNGTHERLSWAIPLSRI
ncbi:hypothetical protein SDRG_07318, partial [Saprolegnia diclina VS20]